MANATFAVPNFLGGEISQFAQGRFDRPDYKVSLNVCLNSFPVEIGAWTRRPGTRHGGHTRGGATGRNIKFDFEQSSPVTIEFTDGKVRFRNGATLIAGNDPQTIVAISAANPAVVQMQNAVTWATGDTVILPGQSTPLLENRQFVATVIDSTHLSIKDALTGAGIDGSTLGALVAGATIARVHELSTVYSGTSWSELRAVQAETTDILLGATAAPQALTVATLPDTGVNPVFAITSATFNDGPYLDPPINGVQVTPSAVSGLVNLTLSFPAYSATTAYASGAFVTSAGIDYKSLIDQNVGNTPVSSPSAWVPTSASTAVNNGQGFLGTDVGRLVRLLSEPAGFNPATTYSPGTVVTYNPSGVPGASTYWQSKTTTTSSAPGADLTNWELVPSGAAIWSWGRITALSNVIDRHLSGSTSVGDMTLFNGITAPFDGNFSKSASSSAGKANTTLSGFFPAGVPVTLTGYVGKNYASASPQKIQQATIYPTNDLGFGSAAFIIAGSNVSVLPVFTLNLRAKQTPPGSSSDGTLLGSTSFSGSSATVTILSNDQSTAWNYVWIELVLSGTPPQNSTSCTFEIFIAQISLFNPTSSTSSSAGCSVEILGPALLYTAPINTWRLGVFSNTTGWPTCGTYHEGRIWLGGAVANRFDASVSNGIVGSTINFAPTDQFGVVANSNGISEVLNSDSVNPIRWMIPDLQGVIMGTQGGEWLVLAPSTGPISPTNIAARRVTKIGCDNVEPRRTEHTIVFVKRYARKVMEYFADVYSGKFSAPNLAERAEHITHDGVAELAYTEAVTPILWGRDDAGGMFGVTYKRDTLTTAQGPTYAAWHRHELGSGRTVESICSGPSVGGDLDALTLVTNDATTTIRHVEVLTDTPDELSELATSWFLDNAVNPSSVSATTPPSGPAPYGGATLNGLWHLNGSTVQVFAGGLDCGDRGDNGTTFTDFVVTNGSVFVPFGDGVSAGSGRGLFTHDFFTALPLAQIVVGFTYDSDGQIVRRNDPGETGARNGPAMGKKRRNHRYTMQVVNTRGISVGCQFTALYPSDFKLADDTTSIGTLDVFSGIHQDALQDDYSYDGMMCWRVSRPFPATVAALAVNTATQDQ